jgi:opacity protein-like surface antigen
MLLHRANAMRAMCVIVGGLAVATLGQPWEVWAQGTVEPQITPSQRGPVEEGTTGTAPADQGTIGTSPTTPTPRTDQAIAEQQRRIELERRADQERLARAQRYRDDHRHHGETYVAGFGGVTFGGTTMNMEGRGSALGTSIDNPSLANSAVYGLKIGYFHPGRLNWLGLEVEGFNSTPHIKESGGLPGTHLRLTTLGLNVIARKKLACRDREDRRRSDVRDPRASDVRDADYWDADDYSALHDNARCPMQVYGGVGLGLFFAETSNQFGRASDNGRAGLNALAGMKYFFNEHIALFAEYKFNYVDLKFDQNQINGGPTAGLNGTYLINHVVGGLAYHF